MQTPVVQVDSLQIAHQQQLVLNKISFSQQAGELVYLIGKTGSGKSSLLRTLYADMPIKQGTVKVAGYSLGQLRPKEVPHLRRKLGIIFQDFALLTDRSVAANLSFVLKATGWVRKKEIAARIEDVLAKVGLEGTNFKLPHQLSGGEQQRLAIARALLNKPELIIADEPTGNLDPAVARKILSLFSMIAAQGTAVIMATHHHSFLALKPARVLFAENGHLRDVPASEIKGRFTGASGK
jgi:cell division transport system ATP-binding protein